MYHRLTKKEIRAFIRKYLNPFDDYTQNITEISSIKYNDVTEYLINNRYIIKVYAK